MVLIFGAVVARNVASASHPTALWRVVHNLCVVDKRAIGLPAPCTAVNLAAGVAIVKDAGGPTGYLVVPTRRLTGIEDPALLASDTPNYWQSAWDARRFVERKARRQLDRADIAVAINSIAGRTQSQLHFHVDCVRADVKAALGSVPAPGPNEWTAVDLLGQRYWVARLEGSDLGSRDPFKIVAKADFAGRSTMGEQTLVLVGTSNLQGSGFYLVAGASGAGDRGHGEELLDHQCRILR